VKIKFLADGLRDGDDSLPPDGQRGEVWTTPMSDQCHAAMVSPRRTFLLADFRPDWVCRYRLHSGALHS
jgi:hypothetical protein